MFRRRLIGKYEFICIAKQGWACMVTRCFSRLFSDDIREINLCAIWHTVESRNMSIVVVDICIHREYYMSLKFLSGTQNCMLFEGEIYTGKDTTHAPCLTECLLYYCVHFWWMGKAHSNIFFFLNSSIYILYSCSWLGWLLGTLKYCDIITEI